MSKVRELEEFNVVAYLLVIGFQQAARPTISNNRATFYFEDTPELSKAITAYYMREVQIDPMSMAESVRRVKAIIANLRRDQTMGVPHE